MEDRIIQLEKQVEELKYMLSYFMKPDSFIFERNIQHKGNKLGFFGKTPVSQQTPAGVTIGMITGSGATVTEDCKFGGTGSRYTVHDIVIANKAYGILAQ